MQIEYISTLKSKLKSFIDENSISFKKLENINSENMVSTITNETSSVEIALVSFYENAKSFIYENKSTFSLLILKHVA